MRDNHLLVMALFSYMVALVVVGQVPAWVVLLNLFSAVINGGLWLTANWRIVRRD